MINGVFTPETVEDAISLKKKGGSILFLAGGTDINNGGTESAPEKVISLSRLNLNFIKQSGSGHHGEFHIGPMTTIQEICDSEIVPKVLKTAGRFIQSRNIRNMATIGGNIAVNSPESYMLPTLVALDSDVETSEGRISVYNYIKDKNTNLITNIIIPEQQGNCITVKVSKSANYPATVTAAVSASSVNGKIRDIIIAAGGVDKHVIRLTELEKKLKDGTIKPGTELEKTAAEMVSPKSDLKGSAEYKRYICGVLIADCLEKAL